MLNTEVLGWIGRFKVSWSFLPTLRGGELLDSLISTPQAMARSGADMVIPGVTLGIKDRGLPDRSMPSSFNLLARNEQRHLGTA